MAFPICLNCGQKAAAKKFCSKSCAASHNNRKRKHSEETKKKIGLASSQQLRTRGGNKNHCSIKYVNCKVCDSRFAVSISSIRQTCSTTCRTDAKTNRPGYRNGSRKNISITNPTSGEEVWLESSWELQLAKLLIKNSIEWMRPKSAIHWTDSKGNDRNYYPDFYLPNQGIYLDPKNPYCMGLDEEKMRIITQDYYVFYGDINLVISKLESFLKRKL